MTAIVALSASFAAQASVSCTLKWDKPGTVCIMKTYSTNEALPEGATSFELTVDYSSSTKTVYAAPGYELESVTWTSANGTQTGTFTINSLGQAKVKPGTCPGGEVYIKVKELVKDGKFNLTIENGAKWLEYISMAGSVAEEKLDLSKGNGTYEIPFAKGKQQQLFINKKSTVSSIYSVTLNGNKVNPSWDSYYVNLSDGANIVVRVFETEEPAPTSYTLKLNVNEDALEAVKSVYNITDNKWLVNDENKLTSANSTFTLEEKSRIKIKLHPDWDITSVTDEWEEPISYDKDYNQIGLTMTGNKTVNIEAKAKEYTDVTYTLYTNTPEGLDVWAGTAQSGVKIELADGEAVTEDIALQGIWPTTLKAGEAWKYTFTVSSKYGRYIVFSKEGYYIYAGTFADKKTAVNAVVMEKNPVYDDTGNTVLYYVDGSATYFDVRKIDQTAKMIVYAGGEGDKCFFKLYNRDGGQENRKLVTGYNEVMFDPVYHNGAGFRVMVTDEADLNNCLVLYNGNKLTGDPEHPEAFACGIKDGAVLRCFFDKKAHTPFDQTYVLKDGAQATIGYDRVKTLATPADGLSLYEGTEVVINPADPAKIKSVKLDGAPLAADADGKYAYTVSGEHIVFIQGKTAADAVLSPANGETVTAWKGITVSFPDAKKVEQNPDYDVSELLLRKGYSWFAGNFTVTAVEGASCPTFVINSVPAPTVGGDYYFYIPQGFFVADGAEIEDTDITFSYAPATPLSYTFDPEGEAEASEYPSVTVIFDEAHGVDAEKLDDSKIAFTFNGEALVPGEDFTFETSNEMPNYLMFSFGDKVANKTGELALNMAAGALTFYDGPSPVIEHTWTFGAPAKFLITFDPADGQTVESLESFTLTFPNATSVSQKLESGESMLHMGNAWAAISLTYEAVEGAEHPTFKVTVNPAPTAPGNYSFYLPDGFFTVDGDDSKETTAAWTLEPKGDLTYTFSPEANIVANQWGYYPAIVFDENHTISGFDRSKITVKFDETVINASISAESNYLMFEISEASILNKAGKLSVSCEAGAITFHDGASPAIEHTWNILENRTFTCVVTPETATQASQLQVITVSFPEAETAEVYQSSGASLRKTDYKYFSTGKIEAVEGAAHPTFTITFTEPTLKGDYTFLLNLGTFTLDGAFQSPDVTKNYASVSGIADITVDGEEDNDTIYNLQGIKLQSQWKDLPAGLYIKGGKKVLKK